MNNFTPRAGQVLALSRKEAHRFGHRSVGTEHLLLGLIRLRQGLAVQILRKVGFDLASTRADLKGRVGLGTDASTANKIPLTASAEKVISLAAKEAKMLGHKIVDAEHIFLGLLKDRDCDASKMLGSRGVEVEWIRAVTLESLRSGSAPSGFNSLIRPVEDFHPSPTLVMNNLAYFLLKMCGGSTLSNRN